MAGIYFHIPFCKVKCSYCDFYKSTKTNYIEKFLKNIKLELWLQRDYLNYETVNTIYFGGGTPSLLSTKQIEELLKACYTVFPVNSEVEITIEANPDDLSLQYLLDLREIGVNRISIGIQSMKQVDLKLMQRRHNPIQAANAVKFAKQAGFTNISVDLIYGIPATSIAHWKENLQEIFSWDIQHISAYHLTYHEGTKMWNDLKNNKIREIDEKVSIEQFEELVLFAKQNEFIHYEISNFSKEGYFSKHNSSYWKQINYLGLGPSAHSYNKVSRQWNVSSLSQYLSALSKGVIPFQLELLSVKDRFNDYLITTLRTIWGTDLDYIEIEFGDQFMNHLYTTSKKYIAVNQLIIKDKHLFLAYDGQFISDSIMADLMFVQ